MKTLGNEELIDRKLATVLNSSQSKTPCGNDSWVRSTAEIIPQLIQSGYTIVTSLGLPTWELAVHLVSISLGNQVIISTASDESEPEDMYSRAVSDFDLDPSRTAMIYVSGASKSRSPKTVWPERDRLALELAQIIVPVSIRPKGRLEELLAIQPVRSKIDSRYKVEYRKSLIAPSRYDRSAIMDRIKEWDHIAHWTRTCHGPWPGEKKSEYYRRLLETRDAYPNDAFSTLLRIADERRIRASTRGMREGRSAIGFSESTPEKAMGLMRWCPKRVNWNFEPFGVAIHRDAARQSEIRPVTYGDSKEYRNLPDCEKPYFQSRGRSNVDWSREREWRHTGDLDLRRFDKDDLIYLVWRESDAAILRDRVKSRVLSLAEE